MPEIPLETTVEAVHQLRHEGKPLFLVDVREPLEYAIARIEGAILIPMREVPGRLGELEDREEPVIILCHHGVRSLNVAAWLRERGVANAQSMTGGIDLWSRRIDPSVPLY